MKIDLRYPIVFGVFYLPGLMMLIGALALGFHIEDVREGIGIVGGMIGFMASVALGILLFVEGSPIYWGDDT